ncbi:MAG: hypothetical protein ACFFAO_03905 [Candidatus Hermodarchaeota archaeon]
MAKMYCKNCGVKCKLEEGEGIENLCAKCYEEFKSTEKTIPRHFNKFIVVGLCFLFIFGAILFIVIIFFIISSYGTLGLIGLIITLFGIFFIYLKHNTITCPQCKKWSHKSDRFCSNCGTSLN